MAGKCSLIRSLDVQSVCLLLVRVNSGAVYFKAAPICCVHLCVVCGVCKCPYDSIVI